MKNIPVITLIPRIWLTVAFAIVSNIAVLSKYPILKEHWEHSTVEAWNKSSDGEWAHVNEETWVNVPARTLFDILGAALYVPAIMSLVVLCAIVAVHLHFRETIDQNIHEGVFLKAWQSLTGEQRVRYTVIVLVSFLLAGAIVASGVGK